MTDSYTITITNTRSGVAVATATVEIGDAGVRLAEVGTEIDGEYLVPEVLATFDFPFLVRTANMLSGASAQDERVSEPDPPLEENETKSQEMPSEPSAPPADGRGVTLADTGSSERLPADRERAMSKRDQRAGAPSDFGVTYWRLGSTAKVAKHYDVPHRIAQDWIKSLQQQGKLASPWPSKTSRSLRPK
ncbi:hypothetical protein [Nocardia sp. NPDC057272]|uniref:hypothetical protein n=1 Tax=Nocardia sp. NPDC057272 TaxID=3346079 RepID=UPI00363201CB